MASTSSSVASSLHTQAAQVPLWLWPNLLSLDAPFIALLWQDVFARDAGVQLAFASRSALALAVWFIYLVDRLLDTSNGTPAHATARHIFNCTHRVYCYWLTAICAGLLAFSVLLLPRKILVGGLVISGTVALYLLIVHWMGGKPRRWLPKEAAVGLIFAIGTGLAPFERAPDGGQLVFPALLFGVLCWLNSSAIEVWEGGNVDGISSWAVRHMKLVACILGMVCLLLNLEMASHHSTVALVLSALGYWAVADTHKALSADTLRVGIDVPLLAPLLMIGLK